MTEGTRPRPFTPPFSFEFERFYIRVLLGLSLNFGSRKKHLENGLMISNYSLVNFSSLLDYIRHTNAKSKISIRQVIDPLFLTFSWS